MLQRRLLLDSPISRIGSRRWRREAPWRRRTGRDSPRGAAALRAGIIGTGFIGRVHARSALLAGGRIAGVAASSPRAQRRGRRGARRRAGFATAEELIASDDDRRRPRLHAEPPAPAARARRRSTPASTSSARSRSRSTPPAPQRARRGRGERRRRRDGALRLPLLPDGARGARPVRAGATATLRLLHGGYLQDWLLSRRRRQLARRPRARRRLAGLRRHRLALVRPDRVRLRPADHRARRADGDRPPRAPRSATGHSFERGDGAGAAIRGGRDRGHRARACSRPTRGAVGSVVISPGLRRAQEPALVRARRVSRVARLRPGERRRRCGSGRRGGATRRSRATSDALAPRRRAYVTLPGGHPQGYADCFDAFVAETYAAIRGDGRA